MTGDQWLWLILAAIAFAGAIEVAAAIRHFWQCGGDDMARANWQAEGGYERGDR